MKLVILLGFFAFILISFVYSATLTCSFSRNQCIISNLTPVTSANEEIIVAGQPLNYTNNKTSLLCFISPMIVNFVPTNIFKIFTKIQLARFNNVQLRNLVSNAFINCDKLEGIDLTDNNFPVVPASFASACVNLKYFTSVRNNIKELNIDAFKGLSQLKWIYMFENSIACIPPGLFSNTPLLTFIDLSSNKISEIDPNAFNDLFYLNSLQLDGNNIINLSLNLNSTGLSSYFMMMFEDNPFNSIDPTFLTKFFTSQKFKLATLMFNNSKILNSCIPDDLTKVGIYNWEAVNNSLITCYANWKSDYATKPVSCAAKIRSRVPRRFS